jgi:SPP1 gp7 family putative phage head morphogenesis protein
MLSLQPNFYAPIEDDLIALFYQSYYLPLLNIIDEPSIKLNAVYSAILAAINAGKVQYKDGVFSGTFNIRISRELATFAKFDKRTGKWTGRPSADILAASINANAKRARLNAEMRREMDKMEARIGEAIQSLSFGSDLPLLAMDEEIRKSLYDIGVVPEINERVAEKLRADYTESQKLNIKNWAPEQTERLREMVERIQTTSDNSSIREEIMKEWGTTAAKAKFLARQETSLFFSKLSMQRAGDAGVRRYRWSTSHDARVRDSPNGPNHKHLQGLEFDIDGPGGIVDLKTGRRAHPGQDYNCRCAAIWVLE